MVFTVCLVFCFSFPGVFSLDPMNNKSALEAYKFFEADCVQLTRHYKTPLGNYVFQSDVRRSYRVTEEPHHPWVCLLASKAYSDRRALYLHGRVSI